MSEKPVKITLFKWAGSWGPFSVKVPCGECTLTKDVILDTINKELKGIPIELDIREWLSEWWRPLLKGGWHAPIVMVEGQVISQGRALNRGILTQAVIENHVDRSKITGNHLFGKESCPHCIRAKAYMKTTGLEYTYHDVVRSPRSLYEMIERVKPIIGPKTPITVPQIWIEGSYVGGADQLSHIINQKVEHNNDHEQCSFSPEMIETHATSR